MKRDSRVVNKCTFGGHGKRIGYCKKLRQRVERIQRKFASVDEPPATVEENASGHKKGLEVDREVEGMERISEEKKGSGKQVGKSALVCVGASVKRGACRSGHDANSARVSSACAARNALYAVARDGGG